MSEMMEKALLTISNNMSNKFSSLFTFTRNESEFTSNFKKPIKLDPSLNYQAALIYFSTFNTVFNIDTKSNNNKFIYSADNGTTWKTITIPDGGYEITQLNEEIKKALVTNNDTTLSNGNVVYPIEISMNLATTKTIITISTNFKVKFEDGTLGYILGYDNATTANPRILSAGTNNSDSIARINNITAMMIHVDIVGGHYVNGEEKNIIYTFPANTVIIGYKLNVTPTTPIYLPVNVQTISKIYVKITDEKENLISFNGEEISLMIHLRQV